MKRVVSILLSALVWAHGGNVESYTTNMQILPGQGVAIIVMFNACNYFVSNAIAL